MTPSDFEQLVAQEAPDAVPEKFRAKVANVAFLVEDEPSPEVRKQEDLLPNETLLGLYHGIPATARGDLYGIGNTLPDTITLFRIPVEEEARDVMARFNLAMEEAVRKVIRETIWHEVAHHFGMDETAVREREQERGI